MQYTQVVSVKQGNKVNYQWLNWSSGVQQTNAGDLKMVTEWEYLPFIIRNPYVTPAQARTAPSDLSGPARYVSIEPYKGG